MSLATVVMIHVCSTFILPLTLVIMNNTNDRNSPLNFSYTHTEAPDPTTQMACNLDSEGKYKYTRGLLELDSAQPSTPVILPDHLTMVTTPLILPMWQTSLAKYPDPVFVSYLISSFTKGFHIGARRDSTQTSSSNNSISVKNMRSAAEHPDVIDAYLLEECLTNRVLGPITCNIPISISPFGVIPKKH